MVMEVCPSPQSVGREFVRQYYTLLNKAPAHLHRFYNNQSSFVHGGLDAPNRESLPVIGQKQIHNRIQQLNFRDCHAKISQVDSQATLGNGVVVQVTGELSNGGAPMRRFTQTFVLAAQSPKKYYVHNDIFRYQDIVFGEEESVSEQCVAEEQLDEEQRGAMFGNAEPINGHPQPHTPTDNTNAYQAAPVPAQLAEPEPMEEAPMTPPHALSPPPPPMSPLQQQTVVSAAVSSAPPEPKTYANLLKCRPISNNNTHQPPPPAAPAAAMQHYQPLSQPQPSMGSNSPPERARPQRPINNNNEQRRYPDRGERQPDRMDRGERLERNDRQERAADGSRAEGNGNGGGVQLFLGKLPAGVCETSLRALFTRFGAVIDLRVHAKQGGPQPSYGFVTFENMAAARRALQADLYYPEEGAPNAVRLNVEEKRARMRPTGPRPPPGRSAFMQRGHFRR